MDEPKKSEMLTLKEMAAYLRIAPTTLHRLVHGGKIPGAFRIGYSWRFDKRLVEQWILDQGKSQKN